MPSVTPSRQSLFGHRERSGVIAQAIDEPRHGDKVDRAGDGHNYQPGDGHLPPWIPNQSSSPCFDHHATTPRACNKQTRDRELQRESDQRVTRGRWPRLSR